MDDIAIKVENLSKTFKLPHEKYSSVKSVFVNFYKRKKTFEVQHALKDVSFQVKKGEFFGIVGRNGSGKSTLLKLIAGIYAPTKGKVTLNGSLTPFIELGVGFNPELTGRENVFLNGALLGINRKQMRAMYKDIVEFAELEEFMDQKLKNYSSGMQVRLAFSIAIRAHSDILLLDEVLAVGDAAFQQKCFNYFEDLKRQKKTMVLVSHSLDTVRSYCNRGILINEGKVIVYGPIRNVLDGYTRIVLDELERGSVQDRKDDTKIKGLSTGYAEIIETEIYDKNKKPQRKFIPTEEIYVKFQVKILKEVINPILGVTVWGRNINRPVFAANTLINESKKTGIYKAGSTITFSLKLPDSLNNGEYHVEPAIANEAATVFYDQKPKAATFYIGGGKNPFSILDTRSQIVINEE